MKLDDYLLRSEDYSQEAQGIEQTEPTLAKDESADANLTPTPRRQIYEALDMDNFEVRLVAILPGADGDDVHCKLIHVPLYAELQWEALSYTWGGESEQKQIHLNGSPFLVRKNLHCALLALRREDTTRFIWIDAICINQEDNDEKSREVQRMRHVYGEASGVVVWLGDAADNSDIAMDLATRQTLGNVLFGDDAQWSALGRLVCRPWWKRVWCLQELACSKEGPIVLCGNRTVGWLQMTDTTRKLPDHWARIGTSLGEKYGLARRNFTFQIPAGIRSQFSNDSNLRILWLLSITLAHEASDPRDKVYALIGMCHPQDRNGIVPDYSKTTREVYELTTRYCMTHCLNCLCFNTNSGQRNISGGKLPSWVSDWSLGARRPEPLWEACTYRASGWDPGARHRVALVDGTDSSILRVIGGLLDFVEYVSDVIIVDETWDATDPAGLYRTIRELESFICQCMNSKAPESDRSDLIKGKQFEMLWRTLIADKQYSVASWNFPASTEFAEVYRTLHRRAWSAQSQPDREQDVSLDPKTDCTGDSLSTMKVTLERVNEDPACEICEYNDIDMHTDDQGKTNMVSHSSLKSNHARFSWRRTRATIGAKMWPKASQLGSGPPRTETLQDEREGEQESEQKDEPEEERGGGAEPPERHVRNYIGLLKHSLNHRRLFVTKRGFFGLSSCDMLPGDLVTILVGGDMPFILRDHKRRADKALVPGEDVRGDFQDEELREKESRNKDCLQLISEAYVYGVMDGRMFLQTPKVIFSIA